MQRRRRLLMIGLGPAAWLGVSGPVPAAAADAEPGAGRRFEDRLREGGVALLLRHAITDPGIGDPPGFNPGECRTQRNLSAEGRDQARRLGAWFAARRLAPAAVRCSAWCRCIDTARLAFGRAVPWPPLNSSFGGRADTADTAAQQLPGLVDALGRIAPGSFEVWVTHQSNITAWTGAGIDMGEGFVVAPSKERDRDPGLAVIERLRPGG